MFEGSAPGDAELVGALFSVSTDCLKLMDPQGLLQQMNPCGLALMEIADFSTLRGQPWADLWPEETRAIIVDALERARDGASTSFSAFCPTALGDPRWSEVSVQPIRDRNGKVVRIFAASRDATSARLHEQNLQAQIKDKEAALQTLIEALDAERQQVQSARAQIAHAEKLRVVGQFVGSIVHDINNVLSSMSGAARLIRRKATDDTTLDILNHVDQAVAKGVRLVRQLLDFARAGGGEPELLDIGEALAADAELMRHMIGPEIALDIRCEDGLWPVLAPPGQLQSVAFNLLGNARDALAGRGRIEISARNRRSRERLRGLPARDYVEILVADNGPGMSPEVLERLGEPFFTTKGKGKGAGLGVPSAFDFAKICGGRVAIDSAPGMGARIALHLPRAAAAGEMIATPDADIDPALHGGATLLIVDNEPALLSHLTGLARSAGYKVLAARDAPTTLAYLAADVPIDLIIADLHLGAGSGLDVARASRARQPERPVIFISGTFGMEVPIGEVLLRKPIDERLLSCAVLEKLGRLPAARRGGA